MKEIRINHIVQLKTRDNLSIDGVVADLASDRILIRIFRESLENASKIVELQKLYVIANTHLGIKNMFSHVIHPLNKNNVITIENNETIPVIQKRKFVRVVSNINFQIKTNNDEIVTVYCNNISAGGVSFSCIDCQFKLDEKVKIKFFSKNFTKDIVCDAQIIKSHYGIYVAKYINLDLYDEDKIVKFVFDTIAKN